MKRLALCLLAVLVPVAAVAQDLDGDVNANVLITGPSYTGCADPLFDFIEEGICQDLVSDPVGGQSFVWVVASRNGGFVNPDGTQPGISAFQFGIGHAGADVLSWTLCTGGAEIPEEGWPGSGTGNAVTYGGGCYIPPSSVAKVGFFTLADGASGSMDILPDPRQNACWWTDCETTSYVVCDQNLGGADLANGTVPICENNCGTPLSETTWGTIKSMF